MAAAVLVALGVRIKSPAPRERTVDGLAAMLGEAVGGVVQAKELVWESSQSFVSELLFGRHILFLASELPGGPRDVYRARVRLTLDGSPLDVTQVRNLTETPRGDDVALELNGSRAVFATLAFGRIQGISVIETGGVRDDDRPPGVLDRALFGLSSFQRTGELRRRRPYRHRAGTTRADGPSDARCRAARGGFRRTRPRAGLRSRTPLAARRRRW